METSGFSKNEQTSKGKNTPKIQSQMKLRRKPSPNSMDTGMQISNFPNSRDQISLVETAQSLSHESKGESSTQLRRSSLQTLYEGTKLPNPSDATPHVNKGLLSSQEKVLLSSQSKQNAQLSKEIKCPIQSTNKNNRNDNSEQQLESENKLKEIQKFQEEEKRKEKLVELAKYLKACDEERKQIRAEKHLRRHQPNNPSKIKKNHKIPPKLSISQPNFDKNEFQDYLSTAVEVTNYAAAIYIRENTPTIKEAEKMKSTKNLNRKKRAGAQEK